MISITPRICHSLLLTHPAVNNISMVKTCLTSTLCSIEHIDSLTFYYSVVSEEVPILNILSLFGMQFFSK